MKKNILIIAFILPWICLASWAVYLACARATGTEIVLPVMGYDPRDLFSGRYIAYQIDWKRADCSPFPGGTCPEDNFCNTSRFWKQFSWRRNQCRFYIPEQEADELDKLFRLRNEDTLRFEVVYSYRPGHEPLAKELRINGLNWPEYLKQNPPKQEEHAGKVRLSK